MVVLWCRRNSMVFFVGHLTSSVMSFDLRPQYVPRVLLLRSRSGRVTTLAKARYYRNIRALRTLHIVRKTLCRSHRIVHTFGLVSFHHTQAHTFGLNKLHSSALITSSHSSPTNKHHSSHHTFNSFTRYAVFVSIVPFFSHKRASQFSCLQVIDKLGSLPIHASHRLIPSNHSRSRRSTSSSIIT